MTYAVGATLYPKEKHNKHKNNNLKDYLVYVI